MKQQTQLERPKQLIKRTPAELVANQRYAMLARYLRFRREGLTNVRAAKLAGSSVPSIWRLQRHVRAEGIDGFLPRFQNCGRRSDLVRFQVPGWVLRHVELIALRNRCSIPVAWRQFSRSEHCPPTLAARLRRSIPESFAKATALRIIKVRVGRHVSAGECITVALGKGTS